METPVEAVATKSGRARVKVFVDFWNFQLGINERAGEESGEEAHRFRLDWKRVGPVLTQHAAEKVGLAKGEYVFDGMNVYASHNPQAEQDRKFYKWITTWLNLQPGIQANCRERRPRRSPRCPSCHKEIVTCPHRGCGEELKGTIEKGVDTLIATDMIRLAWEEAYDIAVLATSDADLVPAVEFLNVRARKVVQAGFPPKGLHLATTCWAAFDAWECHAEIQRPLPD